jgi:hypothetical protein
MPPLGMGSTRGSRGDKHDAPSFGQDSVHLQTMKNIPKPASNVNNVNKLEVMHNGTDRHTGAEGTVSLSPDKDDEEASAE